MGAFFLTLEIKRNLFKKKILFCIIRNPILSMRPC